MKYALVVQPSALADLERAYLWIRQQSPLAADRWFNGFLDALDTLKSFPNRCGLAPESGYFDREIRQLLYGKRGGVYRALFTVVGRQVHVLHIRHGAQRPLEPDEGS